MKDAAGTALAEEADTEPQVAALPGIAETAQADHPVGHFAIVTETVLMPDVQGEGEAAVDVKRGSAQLCQACGIGIERRGIARHRRIGTCHGIGLGTEADHVQSIGGEHVLRQREKHCQIQSGGKHGFYHRGHMSNGKSPAHQIAYIYKIQHGASAGRDPARVTLNSPA
jgi:hypothetical protein